MEKGIFRKDRSIPRAVFAALALLIVAAPTLRPAALIVVNVKKGCGIWLNNDVILRLQVDDNPEPIKELRRLAEHPSAQRRNRDCATAP